jgi:CHAT domain-containing protein
VLFSVPFAALQDLEGKSLIDSHTILTSPSIQLLEKTRQQRTTVERANLSDHLIVGNPTMPSVTIDGNPSVQLDALEGSQREAEAIARLFNTQALVGDQAKKNAVIQRMTNSRVIHLATYGLLDDRNGLDSAIALAPDGTGELNDGLLTAAEIAQMKLNAELAVLSACDTGQGRITWDGVIGLSRSLILAGTPSVLVSLWAVPDVPTAELMTEFYKQWQKTGNEAQALRQAMLTIKEKYPNPRDWAGFTLIGESE